MRLEHRGPTGKFARLHASARRLHTVMEKLLESVSFDASERGGDTVVVDAAMVTRELGDIAGNRDLSKYIL